MSDMSGRSGRMTELLLILDNKLVTGIYINYLKKKGRDSRAYKLCSTIDSFFSTVTMFQFITAFNKSQCHFQSLVHVQYIFPYASFQATTYFLSK